MATRGTESGDQPDVASAFNRGGSWSFADNVAQRTKGYVAFGPVPDPVKEEASNMNFANIVTLPIMPEPETTGLSMPRSLVKLNYFLKNSFDALVNGKSEKSGRFYHEVKRRVPGLWECATNDRACWYEAEMEFLKEREIDRHVLQVLEDRQRMCWVNQDAHWYDQHQNFDPCAEITAFKRQADMNYDTKYKNLPRIGWQAPPALMKQKNRFIEKRWLERQGKSYEELQNMFHEPLTAAFYWDCMKWE